MSQSKDELSANEFGSDVPTGEKAEKQVQEGIQEFRDKYGLPETDVDTTQDGLTDDSRDPLSSQGDTLREATADSQADSTNGERDTSTQSATSLAGLRRSDHGLDSIPCQNGSGGSTGFTCPWDGEQYASDKTDFMRTVVENQKQGYPTRLSEAVKSVYGEDYTNTEYQRLRRLAKRCNWFKCDSRGGFVQIEPRWICFKADSLLRQQYEYSLKARRGGDGQSTAGDSETAAGDGQSLTPKERVQRFCESYKTVQADSVKRDLFREFVTWRASITGTYTIMQQYRDRPNVDSEYLLIEQESRFKDKPEARKSHNRLTTALDKAAEKESQAVMVTLTPDPKRFESHTEILEAVQDGVGNFIDCLGYRLGGRPEYIKSLEFQHKGLPHYHIVLFGVDYVKDGESETGNSTISEQEVRDYWNQKKDIGQQVYVQSVTRRDGSWLLHDDSDGKRTLSYYLSEATRGLYEFVEASESELRDMLESGETRLWRQVLYWASEKQYVSCSNGLKESSDSDKSTDIKQYDTLGAAKFGQIPSHIRDDAIIANGTRTGPE
ncbi:hypothetical protein ACFQJ7_17045 [Halovenus rubra]|uniref:Replication protein n=2 Tax=Halovenus rubra TaxID=869890 RepID=A0ABD5XAW0_9EURY|nr:hypothetical protein [Halovenus rubra]